MEASGLAGFIVVASLVTTLLEHPDLFVMKSELGNYPLLRRVPLGLILGTYIALVVHLIGQRSGAHINPAVTGVFIYLGKINKPNATFYFVAQFLGATFAALLMSNVLGGYYEHPSIHFVTTVPGRGAAGVFKAFVAEFIISFLLIFIMLVVISSKRLEKLAPIVTGVLIAIYLVVETPYSGMSLNPARSFASAFVAGEWRALWIYFTAPVIAMLSAAQLFLLFKRIWFRHTAWFKESSSYPQSAPPPP